LHGDQSSHPCFDHDNVSLESGQVSLGEEADSASLRGNRKRRRDSENSDSGLRDKKVKVDRKRSRSRDLPPNSNSNQIN